MIKSTVSMLAVAATMFGALSVQADDKLSGQIDALFADIPAKEAPGCAVGVYKGGEIIHAAGYGLSNMELDVPLGANSIFRMASVSKQFTAAAVLLLADEGKINLDEDIRTYLPDLMDYGTKVSVRSMLGHTSGMGDYDMVAGSYEGPLTQGSPVDLRNAVGEPFRLGNEDYLTTMEFYDIVKKVPLRHAPNTKLEYSNFAYFLLSQLVERVSGETLRQYADKRIFKPLGMNNTFFADNGVEIIKNRASGYAPDNAGGYVTDMTNLFWVGDGGLHTSVTEMAKWDQNFINPKIGKDPEAFMTLMNTANSDIDDEGTTYANGQFIRELKGRKVFAHSGGWLGTSTYYIRVPEENISTAVLCNDVGQNPGGYATKIVNMFFED